MQHGAPIPHERVLPTLNEDGTRRRIRPKLYQGSILRRRILVGWGLILLFVGLPFVRVEGKPLVLLDVAGREFLLFGRTFLATDGVLLMLLLLSIFVAIFWMTALVGRAWCGWGCPQTVYMELVFRPIERWFEGGRAGQLRLDRQGGGVRRALKNGVFLVVAVLVANIFLAYFVGTDRLFQWMRSSPFENPAGFGVMAVTAGLVFFDFAYFREQMCTVICPYARLQSALLDKDSLVIGYDRRRGEPRHKGKPRPGDGDCVDCSACVVACPTGIDIRDGLQLECIACGQCIDACNTIMPKVSRPPHLIRYASQRFLETGEKRILRPRVVIYGLLLAALVSALFWMGNVRKGVDVTVLRGVGAPFTLSDSGVQNQIRVKVESRASRGHDYPLEVLVPRGDELVPPSEMGMRVVIPENPLWVEARGRSETSLFVVAPRTSFEAGRRTIVVRVTEPGGARIDIPYQILGPKKER